MKCGDGLVLRSTFSVGDVDERVREHVRRRPRGADLRCAKCGACISAGHEVGVAGVGHLHVACYNVRSYPTVCENGATLATESHEDTTSERADTEEPR